MSSIWAHGIWVVKPGNEDAFVDVWTRLARVSAERFEAERPVLLTLDKVGWT